MTRRLLRVGPGAFIAATVGVAAQGTPPSTQTTAVYPGAIVAGTTWARVADAKAAGYCQDQLDAISMHLKTIGATALAVVGGNVLLEYGPRDEVPRTCPRARSATATSGGSGTVRGTSGH